MKPLQITWLRWALVFFTLFLTNEADAQQNNANLRSLTLSAGVLEPSFAPNETQYSASVAYAVTNITVTADPEHGAASIAVQVNGGGYSPGGSPSVPLALNVGTNLVEVRVTSGNLSVVKIYRIVVTRSAPPPPDVQTLPAVVASGGVTLNGLANPQGSPTTAWFEWGPTTNYGNVTPPQSVGAAFTGTNYSQNVTVKGFFGAIFHYRAVGSNSAGQTLGSNATFTLTNGPVVASGPVGGGQPIALGQPSLELNFIICTNGNYPNSETPLQQPFLGEIRMFGGDFAPAGWAFCHGQKVATNQFALYTILGCNFGSCTSSNFSLPDFRSRTAIGVGVGPGGEVYLGQQGGATQTVFSAGSISPHAHTLPPPYGGNSGVTGSTVPRGNQQPHRGIAFLIYWQADSPYQTQTVFEPFGAQLTLFAANRGFGNAPLAQGQTLAISQNSYLYSLLGTNYGGNGTTLFQLPDLRGRIPMGVGQGPSLSARSIGQQSGAVTITMTTAQIPAHQHTMPTVPPLSRLTGFAGSNQPQSLLQPALALRFLISTNGEMPSTSVQATNKMIGEIQLFAGTNVPIGWASCDGQLLNVAAYPTLFGVISNYFGGDGVTTFALPDMRGRIPVGSPSGQPGAAYGNEQFTLTEAQLPAHTHTVPAFDYPAWRVLFGLIDAGAAFEGDAAFEQDTDGDGLKNGFEWATGTNPTNAASFTPLTIAAVNKEAKIGFSRNANATDVTIHLQRTMTFGNTNAWSGVVTNTLGVWSATNMVVEAGSNSVNSVVVSDPLTNHPSVDYRLKISRP